MRFVTFICGLFFFVTGIVFWPFLAIGIPLLWVAVRPRPREVVVHWRPLPPWARVSRLTREDLEHDQTDRLTQIARDQGAKLRDAMRGYR